jgi:hypothetical protein
VRLGASASFRACTGADNPAQSRLARYARPVSGHRRRTGAGAHRAARALIGC